MPVVDLWVNALSPKAQRAFLGQTGNEDIPGGTAARLLSLT
jgi:hypothetical protein